MSAKIFENLSYTESDYKAITSDCKSGLGIITIIWNGILFVLGLVGNFFVLMLVIKRLRNRNPNMNGGQLNFNIYMGIFAVIDVSFNVFFAPLQLIKVDICEHVAQLKCRFREKAIIMGYGEFLTMFFPMFTILMLSLVAFDRTMLVLKPNIYETQEVRSIVKKIFVKVAVITLVTIISCILYMCSSPMNFLEEAQSYVMYGTLFIKFSALQFNVINYFYMLSSAQFLKNQNICEIVEMHSTENANAENLEISSFTKDEVEVKKPRESKSTTNATRCADVSSAFIETKQNIIIMLCVVTATSCLICFQGFINAIIQSNINFTLKIITHCGYYWMFALTDYPLLAIIYTINPLLYYLLSESFREDARQLLNEYF